MSVSRSNLGTVAFYPTVPKASAVKNTNHVFSNNLNEDQKNLLHDNFQKQKPVKKDSKKSNSKLHLLFTTSVIAGLGLFVFGQSALGFAVVGLAVLFGLTKL